MFKKTKDKVLEAKTFVDAKVVGLMMVASQVGIAFANSETSGSLPGKVSTSADSLFQDAMAIARPVAIAAFAICMLGSLLPFVGKDGTQMLRKGAKGAAISYVVLKFTPLIFNYLDVIF